MIHNFTLVKMSYNFLGNLDFQVFDNSEESMIFNIFGIDSKVVKINIVYNLYRLNCPKKSFVEGTLGVVVYSRS